MAFQSIWYFTNLPEEVVEIIEKDLSINFDGQMELKLHGMLSTKKKLTKCLDSNNTLVGWLCGIIERAIVRLLYDLGVDEKSIHPIW